MHADIRGSEVFFRTWDDLFKDGTENCENVDRAVKEPGSGSDNDNMYARIVRRRTLVGARMNILRTLPLRAGAEDTLFFVRYIFTVVERSMEEEDVWKKAAAWTDQGKQNREKSGNTCTDLP